MLDWLREEQFVAGSRAHCGKCHDCRSSEVTLDLAICPKQQQRGFSISLQQKNNTPTTT